MMTFEKFAAMPNLDTRGRYRILVNGERVGVIYRTPSRGWAMRLTNAAGRGIDRDMLPTLAACKAQAPRWYTA